MDSRVIEKVLSEMSVASRGMTLLEFTRAIQRAEGNFDCFGTAVDGYCDQDRCKWREDCFAVSAQGRMRN
jgi:hypothetical protein